MFTKTLEREAFLSPSILNVHCSILQKSWRARLDGRGQAYAMAMVQSQGLPDSLACVLAGRGVKLEDLSLYFEPALRTMMPDPHGLCDMQLATERLVYAIENAQPIGLLGDYDVDGACSVALWVEFLRACGVPYFYHIPDRLLEGYGPNPAALESFSLRGVQLVLMLDCGTTSFESIHYAVKLGLETIVIDHHQAPLELPPAQAIVNPYRNDDLSGLESLCAAGVSFMTLVSVNRALRQRNFWTSTRPEPVLLNSLDLVALATIADVVPLTGLNRAFIVQGMKLLQKRSRLGLRILLEVAKCFGPLRPETLGFLIAPRINAGGRVGDSGLGVRLLTSQDEEESIKIAECLEDLNRQRQNLEHRALAEAEAFVSQTWDESRACLIVASEAWHPGVVGLVASRLKERYQRPVFAFAFRGDHASGSGRTITGVDIGSVVQQAAQQGLIVKGGGHALAAGLTLHRAQLTPFTLFMEEKLSALVHQARQDLHWLIDGVLQARQLTPDWVQMLEQAGPFGAGNPEPLFAFPSHSIRHIQAVGRGHLRLRGQSSDGAWFDGIAFHAAGSQLGDVLQASMGKAFHLLGSLSLNHWGGKTKVQLRLLDMALPA